MENNTTENYFQRLRAINMGLNYANLQKDIAKNLFVQASQVIKEFYSNKNMNLANLNNRDQKTNNDNFICKSEENHNNINNTENANHNNNIINNVNSSQTYIIQNNKMYKYFEMEVELLIKNMISFFEQYKGQSDMLKGLVFVGNLLLYFNKNYTMQMMPFLTHLANFYTTKNCQESNYQTLALLAQILEFQKNLNCSLSSNNHNNNNNSNGCQQVFHNNGESTNDEDSNHQQYDNEKNSNNNCQFLKKSIKKSYNNNGNLGNYPNCGIAEAITTFNMEWINSKPFVAKILQTDLDDFEGERKKKEVAKMICLIMTMFSQNKEKIREFRLLNQLKIVILNYISITSQMENMSKQLGNLLYALCQITSVVKFNDKEILKYHTIEILVSLIHGKQSHLLLFGTLKMLKVFWRASIRKTAMIKQGLVRRLLTVYSIQPKLIISFIEEMFESEQQLLLGEFPEFFYHLLETVYSTQSKTQDEEVKNLIRLLQKSLGDQTGKALQILGQGLTNFLIKQIGKSRCNPHFQDTISKLFTSISSISSVTPPDNTEQKQQPMPLSAKIEVKIPQETLFLAQLNRSQQNFLFNLNAGTQINIKSRIMVPSTVNGNGNDIN